MLIANSHKMAKELRKPNITIEIFYPNRSTQARVIFGYVRVDYNVVDAVFVLVL